MTAELLSQYLPEEAFDEAIPQDGQNPPDISYCAAPPTPMFKRSNFRPIIVSEIRGKVDDNNGNVSNITYVYADTFDENNTRVEDEKKIEFSNLQIEALHQLPTALSIKEIAQQMGVAIGTFDSSILNQLYKKLDCNSRYEAVGNAFARGLLNPCDWSERFKDLDISDMSDQDVTIMAACITGRVTNDQLSKVLGVSERTIKRRTSELNEKYKLRGRGDLIALSYVLAEKGKLSVDLNVNVREMVIEDEGQISAETINLTTDDTYSTKSVEMKTEGETGSLQTTLFDVASLVALEEGATIQIQHVSISPEGASKKRDIEETTKAEEVMVYDIDVDQPVDTNGHTEGSSENSIFDISNKEGLEGETDASKESIGTDAWSRTMEYLDMNQERIMQILHNRLQKPEDIEDAYSVLTLKIFNLFSDTQSVRRHNSSYINTMIINYCTDQNKAARNKDINLEPHIPIIFSDSSREVVVDEDKFAALIHVVNSNPVYRDYVLEGMSVSEIADKHEETKSSIKNKLFRFRQKLRQQYNMDEVLLS